MRVFDKEHIFIPADAGGIVARTEEPPDAVCKPDEQMIPLRVAERIVDRFKIVKIQHDQRVPAA